jgi:hypothetical protein
LKNGDDDDDDDDDARDFNEDFNDEAKNLHWFVVFVSFHPARDERDGYRGQSETRLGWRGKLSQQSRRRRHL